jgi:hypothetical protein
LKVLLGWAVSWMSDVVEILVMAIVGQFIGSRIISIICIEHLSAFGIQYKLTQQ